MQSKILEYNSGVPPPTKSTSRLEAFAFSKSQASVEEAVLNLMRAQLKHARSEFISNQNTLSYRHGKKWLSTDPIAGQEEREFESHSTVIDLKFSDITDQNLKAIKKHFEKMTGYLSKQFSISLFKSVDEACVKTGNIIDAKVAGSPAAAFLEMLQKIEFGVDRAGKPSIPTLYLGSDAHSRMLDDLKRQSVEFQNKFNEVMKSKIEGALESEQIRKSKFKKPPPQ